MNLLERIKEIDIRSIIEQETNATFNNQNILSKCPFCGSGSGKNQSPAFSVKVKQNYFRCFSCEVSGTAIDFMIHLNNNWSERQAIKYLKSKYLNDIPENTNYQEPDHFQKTVFAIKSNSISKATEYLKNRKINPKTLPINSYYYDSYQDAIVFFDSECHLINKRFIKPEKNKPKAINQGTLNGSVYDKLYKSELNTIYITEGAINALSMPAFSSISIFSTSNKIKNKKLLNKYLDGKNVVLAFDNDIAGNKCTEYYLQYLVVNRFNIQSVQHIIFPEKKDANDLLIAGELDDFLATTSNYTILWEDILQKPIPIESENKSKDNEQLCFYKEKGCYYNREFVRGKPIVKKLSNFLMEILFHLVDGTKDTSRIIKFQRNTGEIVVKEILSSELNLDKFKKIIRSISGRGLSYFGNTIQLEHILAHLQDHEHCAEAITQLGYQDEHKLYAFADAIITNDNELHFIDKLGIIDISEHKFYLAPFSETNLKNSAYNNQRRFQFIEGDLDFKEWAELIYKAYGINGAIGISYIILALFRDLVLNISGFFPFLFLFGDQGAGKSNYINFFLHLFGEPGHGISLLNSTDKGFSRSLTQRKNALYYLKEYTNAIDKKTVDIFKTGYDGELYTMAQKSNDNKTITHEISSACMVDGNELPTSEASLFARMIVLNFEENQFSETSTEAYKKLLKNKTKGFCQVTREILKHRTLFEKSFNQCYEDVFQRLKSKLNNQEEFTDRQLRHIALLITPIKLLKDKLCFPFHFNDYSIAVIENAKSQNSLSNEIKDVNIFWNAIAFKINETHSEIKEGLQYLVDYAKEIIYIKYKLLYPFYVEYCKKNNLRILGELSLKELLTSKSNKAFIPNTTQKARSDKAYTKKNFGSCYMFKFIKNDDSSNISINGVELSF